MPLNCKFVLQPSLTLRSHLQQPPNTSGSLCFSSSSTARPETWSPASIFLSYFSQAHLSHSFPICAQPTPSVGDVPVPLLEGDCCFRGGCGGESSNLKVEKEKKREKARMICDITNAGVARETSRKQQLPWLIQSDWLEAILDTICPSWDNRLTAGARQNDQCQKKKNK